MKLLCCAYFGPLSILSFHSLPVSSLLTFHFLSVIVLICHGHDPNFEVLECFWGPFLCLVPLALFDQSHGC